MTHIINLPNGEQKSVRLDTWKRQGLDPRDELFRLKTNRGIIGAAGQTSCDNRAICSPVEDQLTLGSCTDHALAALIECNEIKAGFKAAKQQLIIAQASAPTVAISNIVQAANGTITYLTTVTPVAPAPTPTPTPTPAPTPPTPTPKTLIKVSRLFSYYATRSIEGTVSSDSGASVRDTVKSAYKYGVVNETLWPYDVSKFETNPPQTVWTTAASNKIASYHSIADGDLETIKTTLISGYLVDFGFDVYSYMLSDACAANGILPAPNLQTETLQGGHSVAIVGFDDNFAMPDGTSGAFLIKNSWGAGWGIAGYFWMGYNYVGNTRLANDFWVIQSEPF